MTRDAADIGLEEGEDAVRALSDGAATQHVNGLDHEPTLTTKEIRFIKWNDLKLLDDEPYLVDGILPRAGLVVVWGPPKSGKSFWVFDMLLHVALGWPYRSRDVEQGYIVYCYFEGQRAAAARKEAFVQRHLREHGADVPFVLMPVTLDLVANQDALIAAIRVAGIRPIAVALDTLNRSLRGSESKDEDMSRYIAACDAIKDAFNCCVVLVHHSGHDPSRYRGHSSLGGADDAMIAVSRADEASPVVIEVEHMKDGEAGAKLAFRLAIVEVGTTRKGKPITSCVVEPCDLPAESKKRGRPKDKLTPKQTAGLKALRMAIEKVGTIPHGSDYMPQGGNAKVTTIEKMMPFAFKTGAIVRTAQKHHQNRDLNAILLALIQKGVADRNEEFVWEIKEKP